MITYDDAIHAAPAPLARDLREFRPKTLLGNGILRALPHLPRDLSLELIELIGQITIVESQLGLVHNRFEGFDRKGKAIYTPFDLGIVSRKVVTDTGVAFIVDAFQNLTEIENLKFHGIGTGGAAEAVGNTALTTELTTQYNPDNTRATGTTTENAANIYRTVGTNAVDSAVSITEHGIFSQAATGGGTLLDRSLFTAVALASGDSLQSTYDLTLTAGG
jgi:hypothetical protein